MGSLDNGIHKALADLHDRSPISGVVSIREHGRAVYGQAFGFANRSESIPNTLDTRFQVASGCKVFTSVAIAQLVRKGCFSFTTPLPEVLEIDFPNFDPGVTIHHLLTHTSGIPDYFDEEGGADFEALWFDRPNYRITTPRDFLPMFQYGAMQFEPGAQFRYCGSAFILLGLIIEQHSGLAFPDYVRHEIFDPCGMTGSGYFRLDRPPARTACAYVEDDGGKGWRTNIYSVPVIGGPDGGAFVTVADMAKFWAGLRGGTLLEPGLAQRLLRDYVDVPGQKRPTHYGYGIWNTIGSKGGPVHYVEGWDPGVAFLSAIHLHSDSTVTIALNTNRSAWEIFELIEPLLPGIEDTP